MTRSPIYLIFRKERLEREKLARANLPQNAENVMEGRRRLVQVVYELGGETKNIPWQEIQTKYRMKYYAPLNSSVCIICTQTSLFISHIPIFFVFTYLRF